MATAMIYDTLKLAEQLEHEAGFDSARAKAMARILAENSGGNLATREDLLVVKADLRQDLGVLREDLLVVKGDLRKEILDLRAQMHTLISELRAAMHASIGELRAEMHALKSELQAEMHALKSELQAEIHAVRSDLDAKLSAMDGKIRVLYWMTGTTLAGVAALLGTAIAIALHIMRLG